MISPLNIGFFTYSNRVSGALRNIGDRVIYLGVKNIFNEALGLFNAIEFDIDTQYDPSVYKDLDAIVFCGTPQLAVGATANLQLRMREVFAGFSGLKVNMGAGAFHFNNQSIPEFVNDIVCSPIVSFFKEFNNFNLLTVRDFSAKSLMDELGVISHYLPCPGFYSAYSQSCNPNGIGLISVLGPTSTYWDKFEGDIFGLYEELRVRFPEFAFVAHDQSDIELLQYLGEDYYFTDREESFVNLLKKSSQLITMRIHSALPAITLGAEVVLLGFDNRIYMPEKHCFEYLPIDLMKGFDPNLVKFVRQGVSNNYDRKQLLDDGMAAYKDLISTCFEGVISKRKLSVKSDASKLVIPEGYFLSLDEHFDIPLEMMKSIYGLTFNGGVLTANAGEFGVNIYGPYVRLQKGNYILEYEVCMNGLGSERNFTFEVVTTSGRVLDSSRVLLGDGLSLIKTQFENLFETPKLEFRIKSSDGRRDEGVSMDLRKIHLNKLN